jgi:hypothetical protein
MIILRKKKIHNLPYELIHDIMKISVGKRPYLIGSGSIVSLLYNSDYDVNEKLIVTDIHSHIENLKKEKNIWIVSVNNTKKYIQINTICNVNGLLVDVNDTIFHGKLQTNKEKEITLKKDIDDFLKEHKYLKVIKRLFTLLSLQPKKNKNIINYLIIFLNSNIGLLQDIINHLVLVLEFYKVEKQRPELIINNIQMSKLSLNNIHVVPIEDKLFNMFHLSKLKTLISILEKKVNDYTKLFIDSNRHIFFSSCTIN